MGLCRIMDQPQCFLRPRQALYQVSLCSLEQYPSLDLHFIKLFRRSRRKASRRNWECLFQTRPIKYNRFAFVHDNQQGKKSIIHTGRFTAPLHPWLWLAEPATCPLLRQICFGPLLIFLFLRARVCVCLCYKCLCMYVLRHRCTCMRERVHVCGDASGNHRWVLESFSMVLFLFIEVGSLSQTWSSSIWLVTHQLALGILSLPSHAEITGDLPSCPAFV